MEVDTLEANYGFSPTLVFLELLAKLSLQLCICYGNGPKQDLVANVVDICYLKAV